MGFFVDWLSKLYSFSCPDERLQIQPQPCPHISSTEEKEIDEMAKRILSEDFNYIELEAFERKVFWEDRKKTHLGELLLETEPRAYEKLVDKINSVDEMVSPEGRAMFSKELRYKLLQILSTCEEEELKILQKFGGKHSPEETKSILKSIFEEFYSTPQLEFRGSELESILQQYAKIAGLTIDLDKEEIQRKRKKEEDQEERPSKRIKIEVETPLQQV